MRWDNLFDDLESQLESGLSAEEKDLQAEEERLRLGRLRLRDRLVALHQAAGAENAAVRLELVSGDTVNIRPATFGRDWVSGDLLGDPSTARARHPQFVLPFAAIGMIHLDRTQVRMSLSRLPAQPAPSLAERLGLPFVLRDLCRRRTAVEVCIADGNATTGMPGTIDRVGHDHFDLALHEPGSPRRESELSGLRIVPLGRLLLVRIP